MADNNTVASTNEDGLYLLQIRDQFFHVEIWLYNQLDKFKPFRLPFTKEFVKALAIEETLHNWSTNGWIVISSPFEILERGALVNADSKFPNDPPFLFRTDGRNKISIKIIPITNTNNVPDAEVQSLPPEKWEMCYDFVIYDVEDLPSETAAKKIRKLYFHDERYQILSERNIEWSTALYGPNQGRINSSDAAKTMSCSDAIQSIIKTAASPSSNPNNPEIHVGSTLGPRGIDNPNTRLDNFSADWDKGSPDSKIFYTSPANSCALEDIKYVMGSIKSEDGSPLFIDFNRYNNPLGKQFSLVSFKKYIENAEKNQIERLVIQDNLDPLNAKPYFNRAPFDRNESSTIKNFQSGIASRIKDYAFVPMTANYDSRIVNAPTHNYNFSSGKFSTIFKGNKVTDVLNNVKDVANGLYSFQKKQGQLQMHINKTKQTGLMTQNNFVPRTFFPNNISYVSMAKDFLFLNQALHFSTQGLTFRSPGNFVFIDREVSNGDPNPFDDRFLGQWMITKVVHVFTLSSDNNHDYITEVVVNKIDNFTKWWDEVETKYF
jgi:hypothetical protein